MNRFVIYMLQVYILVMGNSNCYAQKPSIDYPAIEKWPEIQNQFISNDGRYVCYMVQDNTKATLYVKGVENHFLTTVAGLRDNFRTNAQFSGDSRKLFFIVPGDSLCILDLDTGDKAFISHCKSFRIPSDSNGEWLAYLLMDKDLVLLNLHTGQKNIYNKVIDYTFGSQGRVLLIKNEYSQNGKSSSLLWINLKKNTSTTIWEGERSSGYSIDKSENRLAFFSDDTYRSVWYFEDGQPAASILVNWDNPVLERGAKISNRELYFSPNGDKLFFRVTPAKTITNIDSSGVSVDVWNYKDRTLQEQQLVSNRSGVIPSYLSVVNLANRQVYILNKEGDKFISFLNEGNNDDYLLVTRNIDCKYTGINENEDDVCIVNVQDGTRDCFRLNHLGSYTRFSPGGKYVIWYEMKKKAYYVYNLKNKTTANISAKIKCPVYDEFWTSPTLAHPHGPAPVWMENDEAVLIYDRYDVWEVDPGGKRAPVNLTKGYGRRNKILLRCLYYNTNNRPTVPVIKKGTPIILAGFNEQNKNNGFFKLDLHGRYGLEKLTMTPAIYYFPATGFWLSLHTFLNKARQADVYLMTRQDPTESPNLIVTKDFIKYTPISDLAPQKKFNWLTAELKKWTTIDGRPAEGILYKPENFDPKEKYPVILHFYEEVSNKLNLFPNPELSSGALNIAYFVSHGYIVFCPDVYCKIGKPGESAYNYVVSAAKMLMREPWVDAAKIGIQGHSFGGYEVNYIITRTGMFAAAASASGMTDLVSRYGTLFNDGQEGQYFEEFGQERMAVPLWSDRNRYIDNSPLFGADKVSTPLLLMNNKKDPTVIWTQGIEYFTGLRRLNKAVWMLQYDNGAHILTNWNDQLDYTTRLTQFFDHYLKGQPAPRWMTNGISAKMKTIDRGLELDTLGTCRSKCKVCKKWHEVVQTSN